MKKRILAIMLACFMIVSLLPMQAFATETEAKCPGVDATHVKENCEYTFIETVAPTCEDWGYTVYECVDCHERFVDDIIYATGEHVWVEATHKDATCTEPGLVGDGLYCEVCGLDPDGVLVVIPPLGHDLTETPVDGGESECLVDVTCSRCDYYERKEGNHVYTDANGEYMISFDVERGEGNVCGVATYTCVKCGHKHEVDVLHSLKFVPGENGYCDHFVCMTCEKTYTVESVETGYEIFDWDTWSWIWIPPYMSELEKLEQDGSQMSLEDLPELIECDPYHIHDWRYVETEYTLNEDGEVICGPAVDHFECAICGQTMTEGPYTHHTDPEIVRHIAPGCETWGITIYFCNGCGTTWEEEVYEPNGHDWSRWYVDFLTCTEEDGMGREYRFCYECGKREYRDVEPVGHDWFLTDYLAPNCSTMGHAYYECVRCGETKTENFNADPNAHQITEVLRHEEATCTDDGAIFGYCDWCDDYVSVVIEALGHELHTEVMSSCTSIQTNVWCKFCDYAEETIEEVKCDDLFVYYSMEEAEAAHWQYYTHTVVYRDGTTEVLLDFEWAPSFEKTGVKNPTCGNQGYEEWHCMDCASEFIIVLPATGEHVDNSRFTPVTVTDEYVLGVEYLGGNVSFLIEGDLANTVFTVKFYNAKGEEIEPLYISTDDATFMNIHFQTIEYVEIRINVIEGELEVVRHLWSEHYAAEECTPEQKGWEAHYFCAECGQMVGGYVHSWIYIPATEVTCYTDGNKAGWYCTDCGKFFTEENDEIIEVPTLVIESEGHKWNIVDMRDPDHSGKFSYEHVACEYCDLEYIRMFCWGEEHDWVLNEDVSYDATCEQEGLDHFDCACGAVKEDVLPALGHTYGEEICTNNGKVCERCDEVCNVAHTYTIDPVTGERVVDVHGKQNCVNGEYDLFICTICGYNDVVTYSEADPEKHVWGREEPILDENGYETGLIRVGCTVCGFVKTVLDDAEVQYTVNIDGDNFIVGDTMKVTITMSGNTAAVWGFDIDVLYNHEALEFVSGEFGNNFAGYIQANLKDDVAFVSVAGNADSSADVTEEVVVTLYFKVIDVADGVIAINHNMTTNPDLVPFENPVIVNDNYHVMMMMDYDDDGDVDLLDVQAVYNYIVGAEGFEFKRQCDINADGIIDLTDLTAMYLYIVG